MAALGTGGLPRGKTSERERWLAEMVRGGWSQARKRCYRSGGFSRDTGVCWVGSRGEEVGGVWWFTPG